MILFDQFDNCIQHSNKENIKILIRQLAENSVECDSYVVIICINNIALANEILSLNGGKKIRLLQKPSDGKWTEAMINQYFSVANKKVKESHLKLLVAAGSPGLCVDYFNNNITDLSNKSNEIQNSWNEANELLKNHYKIK